jgi:hypothetical protein
VIARAVVRLPLNVILGLVVVAFIAAAAGFFAVVWVIEWAFAEPRPCPPARRLTAVSSAPGRVA